MPEGEGGQELPYAGTPEMDALFAQINQNPQMLQVVGQNPDLLAEVMKHAGLDTSAQELIDMTAEWPDEAADAAIQDGAEVVGDEVAGDEAEVAEVEQPDADTASVPTPADTAAEDDASAEAGAEASTPIPPSGNSAMPRSNNPSDDLISAMMMQRAVGNPNAPVPTGAQVGRQQRPAIPQSRQSKSSNPRQQMIAEIFRKQGSKKRNANA